MGDFDTNDDLASGTGPVGFGRGRGFFAKPLRAPISGPGLEKAATTFQSAPAVIDSKSDKSADNCWQDATNDTTEDDWGNEKQCTGNNTTDDYGWDDNPNDGSGEQSGFNQGRNNWKSRDQDVPRGGGFRGDKRSNVCYNCNQEGHQSRDCPQPRVQRGDRDGGVGKRNDNQRSFGSKRCYNCQGEGHMSNECPEPQKERGGRGDGSKRSCYVCGEDGHISRSCPQKGNEDGNTGRDRFNSRDDAPGTKKGCFNCGESGHMGRDCPNPKVERCYKCQKEGHLARDCTEPQVDENGKKREAPYIPKELTDEDALFEGISSGINFEKYERIDVDVIGEKKVPPIHSFEEANISEFIKKNIQRAHYKKPTAIQKHCIPIILAGRDLMACAQTGSGKTAAFIVPIINYILSSNLQSSSFQSIQEPIAVILSPTRELAIQIFTEARKFSVGSILKSVVVYGGTSVRYQLEQLDKGCNILVATPGRLKDFIEKDKISFNQLKFLVLDEADRMLHMGFLPDVEMMLNHPTMPPKKERITLMFSATFPNEIRTLARNFLANDYLFVTAGAVGSANTDVDQTVRQVNKFKKVDELHKLLEEILADVGKVLVFVQTKRNADFVANVISQKNIPTTSIHGDRMQREREEAINDFKSGRMKVLVATAVAARGLDIKGVGCVVNFDLPDSIDEYVHRIGRTGRVGNKGKAISFYDSKSDREIADKLVRILSDAQQVVPDWLQAESQNPGMIPDGGSNSNYRGRGHEEKFTEEQLVPQIENETWDD